MRSKIYNKLEESNFKVEYLHFIFYFSSEFYQKNFENRVDTYVQDEIIKLKQRYQIFSNRFIEVASEVLSICYYKKIEKRGFLLYDKKKSNYYQEDK